jgi:NAD(P)-dependent dehydrogenase (short-subunit alcohol dehydrogenase family)
MKIVISGGNSGIGLEAGRQLAAQGHHVVLLGRDAAKGAAAAASIGEKAEFLAADLSSHAGVKAAADALLAKHDTIDALILGAGVLMTREQRTADDLHPIFAVNYLSRYHLAQRLMPALARAKAPKVVILVAGVPLDTKVDFNLFPKFKPFPGMTSLSGIQIANHHYVAWLAKNQPKVSAAVVNVGLVRTEIMRDMPAVMRIGFSVLGPLFTISVEKAASNPAWLCTHDGWQSGSYWGKPGKSDVATPLALDGATTEKVVGISRELTGA